VQIRPARREDAAAIAGVHVRTWQAAYDHVFGAERLARMDLEALQTRWQRWLDQEEQVWVAEDAGGVVGFAYIGDSRDAPEEGEVYAIYALPEAWGTGAGPALMREALDALRATPYEEAILWVLEDNPRARRFYEREGWHADGGAKEDEFLGVAVNEVRYRKRLR
jgi:ribosomal protein S18 acetylase RimI-like enzyme